MFLSLSKRSFKIFKIGTKYKMHFIQYCINKFHSINTIDIVKLKYLKAFNVKLLLKFVVFIVVLFPYSMFAYKIEYLYRDRNKE